VVVRGGENAQVVASGDGSSVFWDGVPNSGRVPGNATIVDVVSNLGTSKETIMSNNSITVEGGPLEKVKERTGVEEGLLEVKVELSTLRFGCGEELSEDLSLESIGKGVVKLDLGVKSVGRGPSLSEGQT